jgi:Fe-S cluster assembly protein SufD
MNAATLPTRKDEAYRYADLSALDRVWHELAPPREIRFAAGTSDSHVLVAGKEPIEIHRARLIIEAGASFSLFVLNGCTDYGRIECDVEVHEGGHFALHAANIAGGTATQEIVTVVRHIEPEGTSRQTVRSVLAGKATGSYLGKVAVSRHAQKVDGEQSVKAMLLDRGATANCKPELEIYADDVKCAHGASVGELNPDQLFYALSRGLDPASAKALLLEGFVMALWDEAPEDRREELVAETRRLLREVAR